MWANYNSSCDPETWTPACWGHRRQHSFTPISLSRHFTSHISTREQWQKYNLLHLIKIILIGSGHRNTFWPYFVKMFDVYDTFDVCIENSIVAIFDMYVKTGVWKQWLMCCVTRWRSDGIFSISLRMLQLEKRSRTNGNNAAVVHCVPASHCLLLDHMLWCGGAVVCGGALLLLEIFRLWTRAATKHSDTGEHTSSGSWGACTAQCCHPGGPERAW